MTTIITATILASGLATRYNPGVMDTVVRNRTRWGQIDPHGEHIGYVALLDAKDIGRIVWLSLPPDDDSPIGRIYGPVMVADCAQKAHRQALIDKGWAVDLSWEVALDLGIIDRPLDGVMVWDMEPTPEDVEQGRENEAVS